MGVLLFTSKAHPDYNSSCRFPLARVAARSYNGRRSIGLRHGPSAGNAARLWALGRVGLVYLALEFWQASDHMEKGDVISSTCLLAKGMGTRAPTAPLNHPYNHLTLCLLSLSLSLGSYWLRLHTVAREKASAWESTRNC